MMVKRQYDHRIKAAIARSKNINLFPHLNIPKTTAKNWIQHGVGNVVTIDVFDIDREKLQLRCLELEDQNKALKAQLALSKFVSVTLGLHIQYHSELSRVNSSDLTSHAVHYQTPPIAPPARLALTSL